MRPKYPNFSLSINLKMLHSRAIYVTQMLHRSEDTRVSFEVQVKPGIKDICVSWENVTFSKQIGKM